MGTHDEFIARGKGFAEGCRRKRLCFGTLDDDYFAYMETFLTPNVSEAIGGGSVMPWGCCGSEGPMGSRSKAGRGAHLGHEP